MEKETAKKSAQAVDHTKNKANHMQKQPHASVRHTEHTQTAGAPKKGVPAPKKRRQMMLLIALVAITAIALFLLLTMNKSGGSEIAGAKLMNVATYHGRDVANDDRQPQEEFAYGDQILVGFDYEGEIDEKKALVTVVVYDEESDEEVFRTNKFRLLNSNDSLQVNINNTNLAAGEYRVELQDEEGTKVVDAEYTITE